MILKHSKQRDAILAFLRTRKDHPTADFVYSNIRYEYPSISLGTVYRNLKLLVDTGDAIEVAAGDGTVHFDACVTPHNHFVCKSCGCVLDLDMPDISSIEITAQENFKGKILGHSTYFYGLCPKCNNN